MAAPRADNFIQSQYHIVFLNSPLHRQPVLGQPGIVGQIYRSRPIDIRAVAVIAGRTIAH